MTAAAGLLLVMAAVSLANAVIGLTNMSGIVTRLRRNAARLGAEQSDLDTLVGWVRGSLIIAAILGVAVAVLLIGLAVGNLRRSNAARVATWIVAVPGLFCGCCAFGVVALQRNIPGLGSELAPELNRALTDAYPSWWIGLNGGLSVAQALSYLVVALLLALPAANAFFRRRAPERWQPPPQAHFEPPPPM